MFIAHFSHVVHSLKHQPCPIQLGHFTIGIVRRDLVKGSGYSYPTLLDIHKSFEFEMDASGYVPMIRLFTIFFVEYHTQLSGLWMLLTTTFDC
jgi:hypothetical protein